MMDEGRYNQLVAGAFKRLLAEVDRIDPDVLEADSSGDMVTLTAPGSGQKCVVNTQRAVRQIWVAGLSQGIHFGYDEGSGSWLDDKGKGLELFSWVRQVAKEISGAELGLA